MEKKINRIDWGSLNTAILLFVFTRPYFCWGLLSSTFIKLGINVTIGVLLYRQLKKLTSNDYKLIILYEIVFLLYIVLNFTRHGLNINGIIEDLPICLFVCACLMNESNIKKVGNYFVNIVIIISAIGLVFFILSLLSISMPSQGIIEHYNEDRSYTIYPLYLIENFRYYDIYQFRGVYDEPGVIGTLFALIYCILKGDYKDWRVWVCLIVGVFSFSFFFYSVIIIYSLIKSFTFHKNKSTIVFVLILFGGFFLITRSNPIFRTTIWDRFEWNAQENKFVGDDRISESGEQAYKKIQGTSDYWWGLEGSERTKFMDYYEGSSSYIGIVAYNGMVFFALYVFFFILFGWKYKKSKLDFIIYLIVLTSCLYQRPNIYNVVYLFLFGSLARTIMSDISTKKRVC